MQKAGGAWEGVFRFKPLDEADAITAENAISDMNVVRGNTKLKRIKIRFIFT